MLCCSQSTFLCTISCSPYCPHFFIGEEVGSEKLGDLPKATQLVIDQGILESVSSELRDTVLWTVFPVYHCLSQGLGSYWKHPQAVSMYVSQQGPRRDPGTQLGSSSLSLRKVCRERRSHHLLGTPRQGRCPWVGGLPALRLHASLNVSSVCSVRTCERGQPVRGCAGPASPEPW